MIGRTISHYEIREKLGEGGMGVVYKAYDTRLKRYVALKFLSRHLLVDDQHKKRFLHEAQAAAGLSHPNICTVHEIHEADGQTFMVMECIEGESLRHRMERGSMDIGEALKVAIQVGKGLSKAHTCGIVHRDIKPGNVLLTAEGDAKIVDFGLAKLAAQTRLTKTGATVGTVMYMSPEQARGDEVDHRTDIWSLGVMLYEMLAGKGPFRGEIEHAVLYSILNQDPEPLTTVRKDVPVALEDIVENALAKDPAKRYSTVDELLAALENERDRLTLGIKRREFTTLRRLRRQKKLMAGFGTLGTIIIAAVIVQVFYQKSRAIDSIAVLPMSNVSGDSEDQYLVDGMTDALINELAQIRSIKVISRTSVMQYKQYPRPLPEIARELGVDAVVEASVLRSGGRVQVNAQLIDASKDRNLWAQRYERNISDIMTLYGDLARAIADEIKAAVTPEEEAVLTRTRPVDPDAYEAYLRGRAYAEQWSDDAFEKSFSYLNQAIEKDPGFAPAYAQLVNTYADAHRWGTLSYSEAYAPARFAMEKAMEIDDGVSEPYVGLAMFEFVFEWDWPAADAAFRRAISLDPNNAETHRWYGNFLVHMGQGEASIEEFRRARELAPLSIWINENLGWAYYLARRYDDAVAQLERTTTLLDQFPDPVKRNQTNRMMMWCYIAQKDFDKAFDKLDELGEWIQPDHWDRLWLYIASGRRYEIKDTIEDLLGHPNDIEADYRSRGIHPWSLAVLGENDRAINVLELIYEAHGFHLLFTPVSPEYDVLRSDPRFQDLLARMNLPWRQPD